MFKKVLSKIAQRGFYIILFLCISAIGISAYVIYIAQNTADTVKKSIDVGNTLEIPFPIEDDVLYDFETETEIPTVAEAPKELQKESEKIVPEKKKTPEGAEKAVTPKKEKNEKKKIEVKEEKTVYTMALNGAITAPFSGDELVKSKTMGDWRIHKGVDIKGELGRDVLAISDGIVKSVEQDEMMGNVIKIEHKDGLMSIYANLADGISLKKGDAVKGGDVVGKIGRSALCECMEDAHLHLEVLKNGEHIDPLSLYPAGEE